VLRERQHSRIIKAFLDVVHGTLRASSPLSGWNSAAPESSKATVRARSSRSAHRRN
jgi:hypothetical protein